MDRQEYIDGLEKMNLPKEESTYIVHQKTIKAFTPRLKIVK